MATTAMGFSPSTSRPIKPLPKKGLRERLSPDVAQSIKYPPAPKTTTPLFYYGYNLRDENGTNDLVEPPHPSERERADEIERNYISRRNGEDLDSDEEEQAYRSRMHPRLSASTPGRSYRYVQKPDSRYPNPQPPASTASSVDGYDSFENTNNKKKRKIPNPGDSSLNGIHLSSDLASMDISNPRDSIEDAGNGAGYHVPGVSHGISGPGRGRYGRLRSGRSPLRTLSDASSNWGNGRTAKQRHSQWPPTHESTGIISASIATAEKYPITPSRGQENVSIFQEASKKSSPALTQFTFTCDSQVPGTVPWPGPISTANMHQSQAARLTGMNASQTSTGGLSVPAVVAKAKQGLAASQAQLPNNQKPNEPRSKPKKSRRQVRRELAAELEDAAQHRREQQKWKNAHQPLPKEEQWICQFCEYEQIFGQPPRALIRTYELKDRKMRQQEAERQRLLEKAKMGKGKKGKKGNKAAPKAAPVAQDRQIQHPGNQSQSQGTQSESNDNEDDCHDEYPQIVPPPSPSPALTAAHPTAPIYPNHTETDTDPPLPDGTSAGITVS